MKATRLAEKQLRSGLVLLLLALYLFTLGGHLYSGDGLASYATAWSIVEGKGGALEDYFSDARFGLPGRDGHFFSKYGLGQAVLEIPFVLLVKGLALLNPSLNADQLGRLLVSSLNGIIVALSALALYDLVRHLGHAGREVRAALGVALLYAVGTMAWTYAHLDFSEPVISLGYIMLARALFTWRLSPHNGSKLLLAGLWLALAITVKVAAGLALLPVLLYITFVWRYSLTQSKHRVTLLALLRSFLWLGLPLVGVGLFVLAYNYYRFGSISETGYSAIKDQFAAGSIYGGLFGFLFSPGKSIFLYSPALILTVFGLRPYFKRGDNRLELGFGLVLFFTYLLFYAFFWNWEGDWTWGARYLLPTFPFVLLATVPLFEDLSRATRRGFYACICSALLVNALGLLIQFDQYFLASYNAGVNQDWRFIPELSPLRGQFYVIASACSRVFGGPSLTIDYLQWDAVRVQAVRGVIPLQGYDDFDLWWLRSANTGNWLVALIVGSLLAVLLWLAWRRFYRAYRRVKEFEQY